jgi:GT2 family glycosyltransferase
VVFAVVPCFQRHEDLHRLLEDLRRVEVPSGIELRVRVIDNASPHPITLDGVGIGLDARIERSQINHGGAGGFNLGLTRAIEESTSPDDFLWLVDSDARVEPGTLAALIAALDDLPHAVAAGSALVDPDSAEVFELGGRIDRRTGEYIQTMPTGTVRAPIEAEYLAACSLLVRRWAAECAGLMSDVFLNGDDVEWTMRLAALGRGPLLAVPASRVVHPRPDRMRTLARYYAARNAFVALAGLPEAGPRLRLTRAVRELGRALSQLLVGRQDLADLHVAGLRDAARGRVRGAGKELPSIEPYRPISELRQAIDAMDGSLAVSQNISQRVRSIVESARPIEPEAPNDPALRSTPAQVVSALGRFLGGMAAANAIASARARPGDWLLGRRVLSIDEGGAGGFIVRELSPMSLVGGIVGVLARGGWASLRLAMRRTPRTIVPAPRARHEPAPSTPTLSIVIASYKRAAALEATLRAIASLPNPSVPSLRPEIIVVDNASDDGSAARVRVLFPDVRLIELAHNVGVEAFNVGVRAAHGDLVLILDDDATPDPTGLAGATALLAARHDIDAVALHPKHPASGESEWAFSQGRPPGDRWPFLGCGNLVRRSAWLRAGGYDPAYFLYRNDTDLALKLLASNDGGGVYFDPSWIVWHDSPAAVRKSRRWFELATRNWIWLCKRHGRGVTRWRAILAGWARAHQLAGTRVRDQWAVVRGSLRGAFTRPPPLPTSAAGGHGQPLRTLLTTRAHGRPRGSVREDSCGPFRRRTSRAVSTRSRNTSGSR